MKKYVIFTISLISFYFILNLIIGSIVNAIFQPDWLMAWAKGQQVTGTVTFGLLYNPIDLISLILSLVISVIITSKVKPS
ncbi:MULTISPECIES: hypothetical protein [Bacillales]|uniref:hypothetical protein n=1 Tax=Bacillales TaxID=1385 RepID=UPI0018831ED0|nr:MULTISPECIES: hypothetical protein [Bacillaceae]MBF0706811.1 hypothetical protein [Pseudalkalibacillus hwajinpoensis]MDO6656584.1 hypothetical protein [Anaerobacillus sp. 1_MG-2023]